MRKTTSKDFYNDKGYDDKDLNIKTGRPRRGLVSFQCEDKIWREFDKMVEEKHGKYKKSYIIENLIRKYMMMESEKNNNNKEV